MVTVDDKGFVRVQNTEHAYIEFHCGTISAWDVTTKGNKWNTVKLLAGTHQYTVTLRDDDLATVINAVKSRY